jgi:hypothetical protein
MSRTTHFVSSGLATLAVASVFTLAGAPAHATDLPCGTPGSPAVFQTIDHPAVYGTTPAITHEEWLWQRDVDHYEYLFTRVLSPAGVQNDWTRLVPGPTLNEYTRTVVDSPAVPAVPGTPAVGHWITVVITPAVTTELDEYIQHETGKTRWESPDWGAQNGNGWTKTGNTEQSTVSPAVTGQQWVVDVPATAGTPAEPAVTHVETTWALSSPGADWTGPIATQPGTPTTETATTNGDAPAGVGWALVATREIPAVIDSVWTTEAPAGYTATGDQRVASVDHQVTPATSATAPAGDGWTTVDASEVTVIDVPAAQVLETAAWTENVLVTPAVPATDPCPTTDPTSDPAGTGTTDAPTTPTDGTDVSAPGGSGAIIDAGGPVVVPQGSTVAAPVVHGPAAQAAAAPQATVLPNTGGVPSWMLPAAFASLLSGVGMIRLGRRGSVRG